MFFKKKEATPTNQLSDLVEPLAYEELVGLTIAHTIKTLDQALSKIDNDNDLEDMIYQAILELEKRIQQKESTDLDKNSQQLTRLLNNIIILLETTQRQSIAMPLSNAVLDSRISTTTALLKIVVVICGLALVSNPYGWLMALSITIVCYSMTEQFPLFSQKALPNIIIQFMNQLSKYANAFALGMNHKLVKTALPVLFKIAVGILSIALISHPHLFLSVLVTVVIFYSVLELTLKLNSMYNQKEIVQKQQNSMLSKCINAIKNFRDAFANTLPTLSPRKTKVVFQTPSEDPSKTPNIATPSA